MTIIERPAKPDRLLGIRPEAQQAWRALRAALDRADDQGSPVPCRRWPLTWATEKPADIDTAEQACAWCPARAACAAFADINRERVGVWGGRDRHPRRTTTTKENAADARR